MPEAVKAFGQLRALFEKKNPDWGQENRQRAELLEMELLTDPSEAQRQLDSREAETKKKLGLADTCESAAPRSN